MAANDAVPLAFISVACVLDAAAALPVVPPYVASAHQPADTAGKPGSGKSSDYVPPARLLPPGGAPAAELATSGPQLATDVPVADGLEAAGEEANGGSRCSPSLSQGAPSYAASDAAEDAPESAGQEAAGGGGGGSSPPIQVLLLVIPRASARSFQGDSCASKQASKQ